MKMFLKHVRDVAIAGFFFLMPVYVVFIILTKAWTSVSSLGARTAAIFGMKSFLGVGGSTIFSGLLLILIWIVCGLLVRFSFVAAWNNRVEQWLAKYVPGYGAYKAMAEEKLQGKVIALPYTPALIKQQEYWLPAYVVEHDGNGNYVVFLPNTPNTNTGLVLLARQDQVKPLPSITANQLDASLKKMGRGLLSEYGLERRWNDLSRLA
jgi:uncharacterized membrane protein